MKEWLKTHAVVVALGLSLAFAVVVPISVALFVRWREAPAPVAVVVPPAVEATPPAVPEQTQKAAPAPAKRQKTPEREQPKKAATKVGPATSKDCAGLTVAACTAKRKDACEKASGKPCVVDPSAKRQW